MVQVNARAQIHRDKTGIRTQIPIVLTENGPLNSLVDYLLFKLDQNVSQKWLDKMVQAVCLLLEYTEANQLFFNTSEELFRTFVQRLYSGTIGNDGKDASGLFWTGKKESLVRQLVGQLSQFSDWISEKSDARPINPLREATNCEQRLAWAAWHHSKNRAFLGHTLSKSNALQEIIYTRSVKLRSSYFSDSNEEVRHFPEERIWDLLFDGFAVPGKRNCARLEQRINLRNILITMLMHFGGLRLSESFHLFVHDVVEDPLHLGIAHVRIFHPSAGTAPSDWFDACGERVINATRERYLRGKFGKYDLRPRTQYCSTSQLYSGWKDNALDGKSGFMNVHWFPQSAGEAFFKFWKLYLLERAMSTCNHPFAFISKSGSPYSLNSFTKAHKAAVERIGLVHAKLLGTTAHGHRHSYGQRLTNSNVDPIIIKKALHHKSINSQVIYTMPSKEQITKELDAAILGMQKEKSEKTKGFFEHGFPTVDPYSVLSGPNSKLRSS